MTDSVITPTPRRTQRYGWLPDLPDNRDHIWKPGRRAPRKLPSKVDLRTSGFEPPIYDQGYLGSCTANAIAGAYEFEQRRQGLTDFNPSRLFIYFEERRKINTIAVDSGAFIRDGLDVVHKLGAPDERLWPYDVNRFTVSPSPDVYADGEKHQTVAYASVDNKRQYMVKTALAMGIPIVFGFTVYSWFENPDAHGVVTPATGASVLGGHAVELVGYEHVGRSRKLWGIGRNSWGSGWGDGGYFYMPLGWICDYANADDFWVIQSVEA
jgi:C1A family cysteine protease